LVILPKNKVKHFQNIDLCTNENVRINIIKIDFRNTIH
jgi:hypothetical protein